jgi:hypothetical protein
VKHWNAQDEAAGPAAQATRKPRRAIPRAGAEVDRWTRVDSFEAPKPQRRQADRSGALAGLVLVATACAGLCFMLYQVTGPRDTFASGEGPVD